MKDYSSNNNNGYLAGGIQGGSGPAQDVKAYEAPRISIPNNLGVVRQDSAFTMTGWLNVDRSKEQWALSTFGEKGYALAFGDATQNEVFSVRTDQAGSWGNTVKTNWPSYDLWHHFAVTYILTLGGNCISMGN